MITLVFDLISSGVDFNVAVGSRGAGLEAAGTGGIEDTAGAGEPDNGSVALGKTTVGGIDFAEVENGAAGGGGVTIGIFAAGGAKTGAGALGAADTGAGTDGNPGMTAFDGAAGGMGAAAGIAGALCATGIGAGAGGGTGNLAPSAGNKGAESGTVVAAGAFVGSTGETAEVGGFAPVGAAAGAGTRIITGAGGCGAATGAGGFIVAEGIARGTVEADAGDVMPGLCIVEKFDVGGLGDWACMAPATGGIIGFGKAAVGASVTAVKGLGDDPNGRVTDSIILLVGGLTGWAPEGIPGMALTDCGPPPGLGGRLIRMVSFLSFFCVTFRLGVTPPAARLIVLLGICIP
ncbi:MAG: hypothetical protein PHD76_14205 [Methylacidiphilales bacterium]|nr:hypothetical protein [Candidatus Methylacidiphilales bacterium]